MVNGTVNGVVICVFHAPFTVITVFRNRRPMVSHQVGIEEHRSIGSQLGEFPPYIALVQLCGAPRFVQTLKPLPMKSSPRIIQELKILGYRHHILAVVPLPANLEIAEDFTRNVRFKRPFYQGTKAVFSRSEMGVFWCDV